MTHLKHTLFFLPIPTPTPTPTPTLKGIAPLSNLSGFGTIPLQGSDHSFSVNVRAFDEDSNEPVSISQFNDSSIRITSTTNEVTVFSFSPNGPPQCTQSASNQSSEAILLFDRSGSIASNDPNEDMLEAGVAFANLLVSPDTAAIAAFTSAINDDIEYLTSGFSSDANAVVTAIRSIRSPDGGTPLWSAMEAAIETGGFPSLAQNKALITFSDGENTEQGNSGDVLQAAQNNNVKLFSVSLNNDNSSELDSLSLATDGLAWSTDDATRVASFSQSLSKVLDGDFIDCSIGINVSATAENFDQDDVILGPARFFKPDFSFAYTLNGNSGDADNSIIMPFTAGRKIGSTTSTNFGSADVRSSGNANSCIAVQNQCSISGGSRFTNNCIQPVTAQICAENGTCETKIFSGATNEPRFGVIFENITDRFNIAACVNSDIAVFQPVSTSGSSPNLTASLRESGEEFTCLYSERMPVDQQPDELSIIDGTCRAN